MLKKYSSFFFIPYSIFLLILFSTSCNQSSSNANISNNTVTSPLSHPILVGAERFSEYLPLLQNKKVALVVNQSSLVKNVHLVDTLLALNVDILKIMAPEHGFRGNKDAGELFDNETDTKTGIPIIALYGNNKKPTAEQLADIDIVIFDIQDVGVRFFTYISTMHLVMEACAENNKTCIILDRPNPLGDYIDGSILELPFQSFVGMHPIPIVHGLTVGELALMINGEGWLKDSLKCNLKIISVENYTHATIYSLPVKPSPNLTNYLSIRLYPSLCFFEATKVSIGRGTEFPFQVIGYPDSTFGNFTFTPRDMEGMQTNPVQEGKLCYGIDLRQEPDSIKFTLKYFLQFYNRSTFKNNFISNEQWFNLLAGNNKLLQQIKSGMSEEEIKKSWEADLEKYKTMRKKYLLYQ